MLKYFTVIFFLLLNLSAYNQPIETTIQRGHSRAINQIAFSPDGRFLVSGSKDRTLKLWEVETGRELRTFNGHRGEVNCVLFHPNGEWVISASNDQEIKLWNIETGKQLKSFELPKQHIVSLALDPTGAYLAVGTTGDSVRVLSTESGGTISSVKGDRSLYNYVDIDETGSYLLVGHDNRKATVHDLLTGRLITEYKEEGGFCGGCPTQVKFIGSNVLTSSKYDGSGLKIRNNSSETVKLFSENMEENTRSISIHKKSEKLITVDDDSVVIWDISNGEYLFTLDRASKDSKPLYGINKLSQVPARNTNQFNDAVFSPYNNIIATADNSNLIILWDAKTGKRLSTLYGYLSIPGKDEIDFDPNSYWEWYSHKLVSLKNKIALSPDGVHAFRSDQSKIVKRWNLLTGKVDQQYTGHKEAVVSFVLNEKGNLLLTGGGDRVAKLWNVNNGELLKSFTGHRDLVYDVAFSHDQTKVLTAGRDGWVFTWDLETGERIGTIQMDKDQSTFTPVYVARFSPNDLYILTGVANGILKLWEIDTGREVREFIGHTELVTDIEFLNDNTIISTARDKTLRYWDLPSGMQLKRIKNTSEPLNEASLNSTRQELLTGGEDRILRLWRASNGKIVRTFAGHKSAITSVHFSKDNKRLFSSSIDGVVKVWDIQTGDELITYYTIDHDWLATNSTGGFVGTDEARKQVFFVQGTKSFELDQFFENYYNPNVLKEAFGELKPVNNKGLLELLKENPTPSVTIQTPKNGSTATKPSIDILVKATNEGGGLQSLKLLQNGKVVGVKEGATLEKVAKGKSLIQKFKANLLPGRNSFEVVAINTNDIESRPEKVDILYNLNHEVTTCYVFSVGINSYKNPALDLNYAHSDAKAFSKEIEKLGKGLYDRIEVHELFDKEATRSNIMGVLDALSIRIKPGDVFYFYYAGHGTIVDDVFYFVPTENVRLFSKDKLSKDGIAAAELQKKFTQIKAVKQVVLMDACQSGGATEILATRGAMEEKAMAQLSRSAGIHVLSAAGSEQFATEYEELSHGLFTYVLLEALKGKADGAPKDGVVTVFELKSYLDAVVPEYSRKYKGQLQFPYTFSRGQDFPLSLIE